MGRSKVEIVDKMRDLLIEMRPLITKSGVPHGRLVIPQDASELVKIDLLRPALEWLVDIHNLEWEAARKARALCTEEVWDRMEKWDDFHDHREAIILRNALKGLRKECVNRNRPVFWRKSKINGIIKKARKNSKTSK